MPNFSDILKNPAGQAKKPATLPGDDYPAMVKSFEYDDKNKNKTPYLRVFFAIQGAGQAAGNAEALAALGVDPSKRSPRKDFYLRGKDASDAEAQNSATYRLDQFLRTCGIEPNGTASYEELIPQIVGAMVTIQITERLNENDPEGGMFNDVGKVMAPQ